MATSLSYLYGWKLAVPTYSAAILTMAARIADDRHWLSDTVAAAALGTFWGRAAYLHHGEKNFRVQPMISWRACGVELSYDF
ncbi:MAG: phosphatase PAP2 family protein, partial [Pseudobdellovibrionaceae bacterium]|nr:phosphatase PAP2 family protein [Pseudobdellovibrionaceae bacterium]